MTGIRTKDLTYGHFGEPTYDTESQQWHFPRQVSTNEHIQPLGSIQTVISGSTHVDDKDDLSRFPRITGLDRAAASYPEVQPAFDTILGRVQGSAAVDHVSLPYDVSKSDLLAFGTASYAKASRHTAQVPIVAFPGGSAAELVTLVTLQNERLRWQQTSPLSINRLTATGGIRGFWIGFGNPVQQIVSAVSVDGDSPGLFAVRHHKAVSILQPRLYDNLRFNRMKPYDDRLFPPSRLLPHEIAIIGGIDADAAPFSDVAFNPWFPEQVATLDQAGVWHVWEVELKSKAKGLWSLNNVDTGSLPSGHPNSDVLKEANDCWGRILWVKDLHTLLLAQRRQLSLLRIGGEIKRDGIPDLGLTFSTDWILEVRRSPANPAHVFVVTSTRVIWLAILPVDEMAYDDGGRVSFTVLLSWIHYRNPQDLSLGLETCQNIRDGQATTVTYLLLYSRLKHFMTVYTFGLSGSNGQLGQSVCDPYVLSVGLRSTFEDGHPADSGMDTGSLSSVIICCVGYTGDASGLGTSDLAGKYQDQGVEFYQVTTLDVQHMLSERLYFRKPTGCAMDVTEPKHKSRHDTSKTPTRVEENFIVPDALVYEAILEDLEDQDQDDLPPQSLQDTQGKRAKALNFRWLAESLARNAVSGQRKFSNTTSGLEVAIDRIIDNLEAAELSSPSGLVTLFEMAGKNISISDIDEAENRLANLLTQSPKKGNDQMGDHGEGRPRFVPLPITPTMRLELGLPPEESFRALYETLIEAHIVPMSENIPGRVLVTIERCIRNIAAGLLLATFTVAKTSGFNDGTLENHPAEFQELPLFNLPVRRKGSISQPRSAQGIRTTSTEPIPVASNPSPFIGDETASPPQSTPARDFPAPSPAERSDAAHNTTHRPLSSLATFSAQPALPTRLTETLQHWTVGADPALYDWAATQTAPTSQTEAETEDWSEPSSKSGERKVKRRKMSRSMDRDRASAGPPPPSALLQNVASASSQPVPVVRLTESQPPQVLAGGGSSQPTTAATQESQGQTMSQLVAGRHGNRRAKPKGLKKRKEGF